MPSGLQKIHHQGSGHCLHQEIEEMKVDRLGLEKIPPTQQTQPVPSRERTRRWWQIHLSRTGTDSTDLIDGATT